MTKYPKESLPVLAKIVYQGDLGESTWYEVVYYYNKWRCFAGSDTFSGGERVVKWIHIEDIKGWVE